MNFFFSKLSFIAYNLYLKIVKKKSSGLFDDHPAPLTTKYDGMQRCSFVFLDALHYQNFKLNLSA